MSALQQLRDPLVGKFLVLNRSSDPTILTTSTRGIRISNAQMAITVAVVVISARPHLQNVLGTFGKQKPVEVRGLVNEPKQSLPDIVHGHHRGSQIATLWTRHALLLCVEPVATTALPNWQSFARQDLSMPLFENIRERCAKDTQANTVLFCLFVPPHRLLPVFVSGDDAGSVRAPLCHMSTLVEVTLRVTVLARRTDFRAANNVIESVMRPFYRAVFAHFCSP
jgi:hypothetical protein